MFNSFIDFVIIGVTMTCFTMTHLTVKCSEGNPFCEVSSTKSFYKRRLYFAVNHEWRLSREIAVFTVGKHTKKLARLFLHVSN